MSPPVWSSEQVTASSTPPCCSARTVRSCCTTAKSTNWTGPLLRGQPAGRRRDRVGQAVAGNLRGQLRQLAGHRSRPGPYEGGGYPVTVCLARRCQPQQRPRTVRPTLARLLHRTGSALRRDRDRRQQRRLDYRWALEGEEVHRLFTDHGTRWGNPRPDAIR